MQNRRMTIKVVIEFDGKGEELIHEVLSSLFPTVDQDDWNQEMHYFHNSTDAAERHGKKAMRAAMNADVIYHLDTEDIQ